LKNDTGKTLDGGPVTVYASEGYAGESLLSTLKAGEKRYITFAVDLGTKVTSRLDTGDEVVRSVKADRGVITSKTVVEHRTTYTISNVDAKEKTILIAHPVASNMELVSPKPEEKTSERYLFSAVVPASASAKITVTEERPLQETITVSSMPADQIVAWLSARKLSPEARKQIEAVAAKKREVGDAVIEVQSHEAAIRAATSEEERLRLNIQSLSTVPGRQDQVQQYAKQLGDKESEIQQENASLTAAHQKQSALEKELAAMIEKLSF
jgi:hypothetical protein